MKKEGTEAYWYSPTQPTPISGRSAAFTILATVITDAL